MTLARRDPSEIAQLVRRAQRGERDAFGELVERYWSDLVALARGILGGDEEAEDLVQDSLVHAWQRLWMVRRPESFPAWLRRSVARRCLTWARRRRQEVELAEFSARRPDPGASLDAVRLLRTLPARQRAVVYLTWIEGCTDREVGLLLGIRASTVRVHRARGLGSLRRLAEGDR